MHEKKKFIVEKVKSVIPDFHENCGPSETITIGLNISGENFIPLGKFYMGPGMIKEHTEIMEFMDNFADECARRFDDREWFCERCLQIVTGKEITAQTHHESCGGSCHVM